MNSGRVVANSVGSLTPRELEVLSLTADGLTKKQVGEQLSICFSTVRSHTEHICEKLGVTSVRQAAAKFWEHRSQEVGVLVAVEESKAAKLLTPRELEVLVMLRRRRTVSSVARKLQISPSTVRTLTERIREKLGVRSMTLAIRALYQLP